MFDSQFFQIELENMILKDGFYEFLQESVNRLAIFNLHQTNINIFIADPEKFLTSFIIMKALVKSTPPTSTIILQSIQSVTDLLKTVLHIM